MPKASKRERQRVNRELRREAMRKAEQRRKTMRTARNAAIAVVLVAAVLGLLALLQQDDSSDKSASDVTCQRVDASKGTTQTFAEPPPMTLDRAKTYTAVMDTSCGKITMALDATGSPVAVNNFVFLAQQKFYDGLDVTRAAKAPPIFQAGSPTNNSEGGPGYTVAGEVPTGDPPYPVGAVAMGKTSTSPPGTSGSQFFVVTGKGATLTADYAYLGRVLKGMDVAKKIASFVPSSGDGAPTTTVQITSVTIEVADAPATSSTTTAPATTAAP